MSGVRFGVRFNSASGTVAQVVRWARLAEDLGFDDVWYCHDLLLRDAWVVLTAVAVATRRIRIGTCIVNPFSASPAELAMRAATLQEVSGGRFVLGIGPGDPPALDWVGLRQRRPVRGLREAIGLLRALLRGEAAPSEGDVFRGWTTGARLRFPLHPVPVPIYVGGQGPRVLELMGEVADGGLPIAFPPETVTAAVAHIRAGAARRGRSLQDFDVAACVWWAVDETVAQAQAALRPLIAYYGPSLRAETLAPIGLTPSDFDGIREAVRAGDLRRAEALVTAPMYRLAITGDPDLVLEQVAWLRAQGVTQINIGPPLGLDKDRALRLTAQRILGRAR